VRFRDQIDAHVPAEFDIHLVLDNYATHKTPKVAAWLKKRPRYHLHFTPTSSSWLNQIERWFAKITEQRIRRGYFLLCSQGCQRRGRRVLRLCQSRHLGLEFREALGVKSVRKAMSGERVKEVTEAGELRTQRDLRISAFHCPDFLSGPAFSRDNYTMRKMWAGRAPGASRT
jgi:transposase